MSDLSPGHAADWHLRQLRLRESIRLFARFQASTRHPCREEKKHPAPEAGFRRNLIFCRRPGGLVRQAATSLGLVGILSAAFGAAFATFADTHVALSVSEQFHCSTEWWTVASMRWKPASGCPVAKREVTTATTFEA